MGYSNLISASINKTGGRIVSLTVLLLVLLPFSIHGQQQRIADSLKPIYAADTTTGEARLELLRHLAYNETNDPDLAMYYADELISLATELENDRYLYYGYLHRGNSQVDQHNLDVALKAYYNALQAARKMDFRLGEGIALYSLGFTYSDSGDMTKAEDFFEQSLRILRDPAAQETPDGVKTLGETLFNAGDFYLVKGDLEKAETYLQEAGMIFRRLGYRKGYLYYLGDMAILYQKVGNLEEAETNLLKAITLLEEDRDYAAVAEYQTSLARIYQLEQDYQKAHALATKSLDHALRLNLKDQISINSRLLADLDKTLGRHREAYDHLAVHLQYQDSLGKETVDMTRFERQKAEFKLIQQEKEMELNTLRQKRQRAALWAVGATALLLIVFIVGGYRRYSYIRKTKDIISEERDRSEKLLLNILPRETAQELKANGRVRAKRFEAVTVLFTDFKGFTRHAESTDPEKLVASLDYYFRQFDTVVDKYRLEKIKTLGDAYMCASGLPFQVDDHAERVVQAALEMREIVERARQNPSEAHIRFEVRIGINSGPVVAGVVGTKKFAYDIWGDTVNIAARMETASLAGRINIAEGTYQLIKDRFDCTYRGSIAVKNRGKLDMYFVNGPRKAKPARAARKKDAQTAKS